MRSGVTTPACFVLCHCGPRAIDRALASVDQSVHRRAGAKAVAEHEPGLCHQAVHLSEAVGRLCGEYLVPREPWRPSGPIVGCECRRQQPRRNFSIHRVGQGAESESSLNLKSVFAASLISLTIIAELQRVEPQLLCNKGAHNCRWLLAMLQNAPRESQVAKHKGE